MPRATGGAGEVCAGRRDGRDGSKGRKQPLLCPPSFQHPPSPLPSLYLVMPVEPVGGEPGEGAQVSKQPMPLQVELDGLQQPRGQAEHQRQVKGPCPVRLAPGGFHRSALRGLRGSFL